MSEVIIEVLAAIGFLLSYYALSVEKTMKEDPSFKPLCDITDTISCSKAFKSKYGNLAGFPNPLIGVWFYVAIFLLIANNYPTLVFYLAGISVLGSLYLAYLQYAKLKTFCIICTSIYIVNLLLLIYSI